MVHPTTLQALSTAVDARLGDGQDVVSREALQPTQSSKTQASKPANPSAIHSLWLGGAQEPAWCGWPQGLRKSAFGCWFG